MIKVKILDCLGNMNSKGLNFLLSLFCEKPISYLCTISINIIRLELLCNLYLFNYLSIFLAIYLCIFLYIYLSIHLHIYLSIYISIYPSTYISIYPFRVSFWLVEQLILRFLSTLLKIREIYKSSVSHFLLIFLYFRNY